MQKGLIAAAVAAVVSLVLPFSAWAHNHGPPGRVLKKRINTYEHRFKQARSMIELAHGYPHEFFLEQRWNHLSHYQQKAQRSRWHLEQTRVRLRAWKHEQRFSSLVALGHWLQSLGFRVSEHPAFGGVCSWCHSWGSDHYNGCAIDINAASNEYSRLSVLADRLRSVKGITALYWLTYGHYDHMHVSMCPK